MKRVSMHMFFVYMRDVDHMRQVRHSQGKTLPTYDEDPQFYLNSVHVRKFIPSPEVLTTSMKVFWQWVLLRANPALDNPLPLEPLKRVFDRQMKYIAEGLISGTYNIYVIYRKKRSRYYLYHAFNNLPISFSLLMLVIQNQFTEVKNKSHFRPSHSNRKILNRSRKCTLWSTPVRSRAPKLSASCFFHCGVPRAARAMSNLFTALPTSF